MTANDLYQRGYPGSYVVTDQGEALSRHSTVMQAMDSTAGLAIVTIPNLRPSPTEGTSNE